MTEQNELRCDAVLACRVTGTRLYGKPLQLLDIEGGVTILDNLVKHISSSKFVGSITLAIADERANYAFAEMAESRGWQYVFGHPTDVLRRTLDAVDKFGIQTVLRATTECPFIYHDGIDELVRTHLELGASFSNYAQLPEGTGFSLIAADALRRSHAEGTARHRSELVTSYIFDNKEKFTLNSRTVDPQLRRSEVRVTVDYPEDLVFCRKVYRDLGGAKQLVSVSEIVKYWDGNPELRRPLEEIGIDWGHGRLWA